MAKPTALAMKPLLDPKPGAAGMEEQGLGWKNSFGSGRGSDTFTSGLEGAWTTNPVHWDNEFIENLHAYEWELTKSSAGKWQYAPENSAEAAIVPDAHDASRQHPPMMLTTDLSLRSDPAYAKISQRFLENPGGFGGCLRPGLVQADPPRHGAPEPLLGPAGSH